MALDEEINTPPADNEIPVSVFTNQFKAPTTEDNQPYTAPAKPYQQPEPEPKIQVPVNNEDENDEDDEITGSASTEAKLISSTALDISDSLINTLCQNISGDYDTSLFKANPEQFRNAKKSLAKLIDSYKLKSDPSLT